MGGADKRAEREQRDGTVDGTYNLHTVTRYVHRERRLDGESQDHTLLVMRQNHVPTLTCAPTQKDESDW